MPVWIRKNAGLVFALALNLYSLIRVTAETPVSRHYHLFVSAGKHLWQGLDPYEFDFQSVGYWFYSQAMGMFFYTPFGFLPERAGLFFHMALGSILFWLALFRFLRMFFPDRQHGWFHAVLAIPVFQAVINAKPELYLFAALLFIFTEWAQGRLLLSPVLAGIIVETKFQPLPFLGLALIPVLWTSRLFLAPVIALGSGLVFHFLPALFLGMEKFSNFEAHRSRSLSAFVERAFLDFDNFFHALDSAGFRLSIQGASALTLLAGAAFAAFILLRTLKKRPLLETLHFAGVLGSTFAFCFSPLGQNNASILAGFWLLHLTALALQKENRIIRAVSMPILFLFLFAYSSLFPHPIQTWFRTASIKAWIMMASLIFVLAESTNLRLFRAESLKNP
jgi:hypothetical protein